MIIYLTKGEESNGSIHESFNEVYTLEDPIESESNSSLVCVKFQENKADCHKPFDTVAKSYKNLLDESALSLNKTLHNSESVEDCEPPRNKSEIILIDEEDGDLVSDLNYSYKRPEAVNITKKRKSIECIQIAESSNSLPDSIDDTKGADCKKFKKDHTITVAEDYSEASSDLASLKEKSFGEQDDNQLIGIRQTFWFGFRCLGSGSRVWTKTQTQNPTRPRFRF